MSRETRIAKLDRSGEKLSPPSGGSSSPSTTRTGRTTSPANGSTTSTGAATRRARLIIALAARAPGAAAASRGAHLVRAVRSGDGLGAALCRGGRRARNRLLQRACRGGLRPRLSRGDRWAPRLALRSLPGARSREARTERDRGRASARGDLGGRRPIRPRTRGVAERGRRGRARGGCRRRQPRSISTSSER